MCSSVKKPVSVLGGLLSLYRGIDLFGTKQVGIYPLGVVVVLLKLFVFSEGINRFPGEIKLSASFSRNKEARRVVWSC